MNAATEPSGKHSVVSNSGGKALRHTGIPPFANVFGMHSGSLQIANGVNWKAHTSTIKEQFENT